MTLRDKTVAVTGAASGIGAAAAALAEADGANVYRLDRTTPVDVSGNWIRIDLADEDSIARAISALPERVDAVLNIAGVPGTEEDTTVLAVNLFGLRHFTESLIAARASAKAIVHVASTAGSEWPTLMGPIEEALATTSIADGLNWWNSAAIDQPAYNFSKAALTVYGMRTAWHWREQGRRVNIVSPGPTATPILPDFRRSMGAQLLDGVAALTGRVGQPREAAAVACFLADDTQASWVNGANIAVDGGFVAALAAGAIDMSSLLATDQKG
jgi:NAD(P)-dependent dehydrogenase (short-subunit alcohol dehydrogenase family)